MDEREKARIEVDARREVAERGQHGSAIRRYLQVDEHHASRRTSTKPHLDRPA
ncbi:MAG TPA: hypothetical protein VG674_01620 [Amycolatopsis sp.]|jgi:hypothetical protein|nr:hypothetical protein [Amycolatopsis sp.]